MIVDLLRNDLGRRLCERATIQVAANCVGWSCYPAGAPFSPRLVEGQASAPAPGLVDLPAGLLAGGSISGAPKLRACQNAWGEIEPRGRPGYCGFPVPAGADGSFDSNILSAGLMLNGPPWRATPRASRRLRTGGRRPGKELGWKLRPLLEALDEADRLDRSANGRPRSLTRAKVRRREMGITRKPEPCPARRPAPCNWRWTVRKPSGVKAGQPILLVSNLEALPEAAPACWKWNNRLSARK